MSVDSDGGRKRHFIEFSLCLSRACLGKIMHFIYKWLKKWRFSHLSIATEAAPTGSVVRMMPYDIQPHTQTTQRERIQYSTDYCTHVHSHREREFSTDYC
jgi:hypothetical protein